MTAPRAIAYDFDGVLAESVNVKTRAFESLFSEETTEQLDKIVSYHLKNGGISRFQKFRHIYSEILNRPLTEEKFQALCERFAELVVDEVVKAPWVAGGQEFLSAHAQRFLHFIVSATPDNEIKKIVDRRGMSHFFQEVLGSPRTKDILLADLMKRYGLAASEMVYIGDAQNDWQAARSIGIAFIWRKAPDTSETLQDFSGPVLTSLTGLEQCLASLAA